jgi:hypothetical protein
MNNLIALQTKIAKLQAEAEIIKTTSYDETVATILSQMVAFGITIDDLKAQKSRGPKKNMRDPASTTVLQVKRNASQVENLDGSVESAETAIPADVELRGISPEAPTLDFIPDPGVDGKDEAARKDKKAGMAAYDQARVEMSGKKKAAQAKARYEANRERILAKQKARYDANPERILAKQRAIYAKNPEKILAKKRARYAKNPKTALEYAKAYYEAKKRKKLAALDSQRATTAAVEPTKVEYQTKTPEEVAAFISSMYRTPPDIQRVLDKMTPKQKEKADKAWRKQMDR